MTMRRVLYVVGLTLVMTRVFSADFMQKIVVVAQEGKKYSIRVSLSMPTSIMIYYDTQKPAAPDNLRTYWFNHTIRGIKSEHRFTLPEVTHPSRFFFRIEKKTGPPLVSKLYYWNGKEAVTIP